jgi:hypothetical protein
LSWHWRRLLGIVAYCFMIYHAPPIWINFNCVWSSVCGKLKIHVHWELPGSL